MALAILGADANADVLNGFHSSTSKVNLDTAEDIQNGHHPSVSTALPFRDATPNTHPEAFKPDTIYRNHHHFSASATDAQQRPTHKRFQADSNTSNGDPLGACAIGPSIFPSEDLHQTDSDIANGTVPGKMQSSKVDLGPHASIVVREWNLLWNTVTTVTPIHVDTDYLGIAKVSAVSK